MEVGAPAALNTSSGTPAVADSGGQNVEQAKGKGTSPIVLDGVDEFVLHGHKWTPEEINKAILRQNDYTKKTQELAELRKQIEEQKNTYERFDSNVDIDIESVLQNPRLEAQFRKIYPRAYHAQLDLALKKGYHREDSDDDSTDGVKLPRDVMERLRRLDDLEAKLDQMEQGSRRAQEEAAYQHLDTVIQKFSSKYQFAVEESVLNEAQAILDANRENPRFKMTDQLWERLWKKHDDHQKKRYEKIQNSRVSAQLRTSEAASDVAPGGAAPGREPRGPKNLSEARRLMIEDMKRGKTR